MNVEQLRIKKTLNRVRCSPSRGNHVVRAFQP